MCTCACVCMCVYALVLLYADKVNLVIKFKTNQVQKLQKQNGKYFEAHT